MKDFIIDHIDPLGQGVFKDEGEIYFIPKTLPNESGTFTITKSSKGVHFGKLNSLSKKSEKRITPPCPHYKECNGCHYLHTDYSTELDLKLQSLKKILTPLETVKSKIKVIQNNERFNYRNRVQLHYHLNSKTIGFKRKGSNRILPIDQCLLVNSNIQSEIKKLIEKNYWVSFAKKEKKNLGHVEIYDDGRNIHINWNKKYAFQGFSQVNTKVNELFLQEISSKFNSSEFSILDLFGGAGNLVNNLDQCHKKISVDIYPHKNDSKNFYNLNLFKDGSAHEFKKAHPDSFNTVFIDPPRTGFKDLLTWIKEVDPEHILYVSCHPATMVRDLKNLLKSYKINSIYLIEFFPSTYHFEAAIILKKILN